jgi:hypothetical protein
MKTNGNSVFKLCFQCNKYIFALPTKQANTPVDESGRIDDSFPHKNSKCQQHNQANIHIWAYFTISSLPLQATNLSRKLKGSRAAFKLDLISSLPVLASLLPGAEWWCLVLP